MKAKGVLKEYQVIGRKLPSEKDPNPPLFKMHIFAPDQIVAKSRFWYFLRQLRKFKKATGEIVSVKRILEKTPLRKAKLVGDLLCERNVLVEEWRKLAYTKIVCALE
ncbi:hypothetical protein quinque_007001 [Culex quinquefasciatus]